MRHALLIMALVACGNGSGSSGTGSGAVGSSAASTASGSHRAAGSGSAAASSEGSAAAGAGSAATTPQVSAKVTAARCDEPCLFLVDTLVADLATAYQAACAKATGELGFDDCAALDVARNCIFAAHGKVYKKRKWKRLFENKSWYAPDPAFKESAFTATETANVKELYHRGKGCKKGLHISAADDKRLAAWFARFAAHATNTRRPAPPLPALIMDSEGKKLDGPAFLAELDHTRGSYLDLPAAGSGSAVRNGELPYKTASRSYISFDPNAMDTDVVGKLGAALPGDHATLRVILVDFDLRDNESDEATVNEGIYVFFIYDANNRLVGASSSTYLLD